jgi:hypothetical protein
MKKVVILQSNYVPWKGYFDLIAAADEFIVYDDVQFTKNDWRNRNLIKTPGGLQWLSVPVGQNISRRIRDVLIHDSGWQSKHWKTLHSNYVRARYFDEISEWLEPIYVSSSYDNLSLLNRTLIDAICGYLGISTTITNSWDYSLDGDKSGRLVSLCQQANANVYISGPAAKSYLDERLFREAGINVEWYDYSNYPSYPQLWGELVHGVSILDLLFNCGKKSEVYMNFGRQI